MWCVPARRFPGSQLELAGATGLRVASQVLSSGVSGRIP